MKYGKLYNRDGDCVFFDELLNNPFRVLINGHQSSSSLHYVWSDFNKEWTTTPPLKDKDLVLCWDNPEKASKYIRFYDAEYNCAFTTTCKRNGHPFNNYKKLDPIPDFLKEWYDEAIKKLED
ncbi:MAG: hypothetical protein ACXAC7_23005 [Candidatus Hodarchaeales archaeon]